MLNTAQAATLKAFIEGDVTLNAIPKTLEGAYEMRELLKLPAVPDHQVWRSTTPTSEIKDAVIFSNYTPANPIAAVDILSAQNVANWLLACAGKRDNLWLLLTEGGGIGSGGIATNKPGIRAALQDATTAIPSGAAGASKSGGWSAIQLVIQRKATVFEKLFSTGAGTTASPATMILEGIVSYNEIAELWVV
jgi:hypothetical protein